jgi:hypothetical protein
LIIEEILPPATNRASFGGPPDKRHGVASQLRSRPANGHWHIAKMLFLLVRRFHFLFVVLSALPAVPDPPMLPEADR